MAEAKQILVLSATADETKRLQEAADKLALEVVLGCADDSGNLHLDFSTRDSVLHIVEFIQQHPVAAIIPTDNLTAPFAARASSMVGLPFHPPKSVDACASKDSLRRLLAGSGIFVSEKLGGTNLEVECVMSAGKLRILAVAEENSNPALFTSLGPNLQQSVTSSLRQLVKTLMLKHGLVRVYFDQESDRPAITDVSLCYERIPMTEAMSFRIPLVDQEISYEELIIRNALDLDITRAHLKT